jgi:hypothetical protein
MSDDREPRSHMTCMYPLLRPVVRHWGTVLKRIMWPLAVPVVRVTGGVATRKAFLLTPGPALSVVNKDHLRVVSEQRRDHACHHQWRSYKIPKHNRMVMRSREKTVAHCIRQARLWHCSLEPKKWFPVIRLVRSCTVYLEIPNFRMTFASL